jgi:hypothetical protein
MALGIRRVTASAYFKPFLYGPEGVGKTTFAVGANDHPAMGPALVLSCEGGTVAVAGRGDVDEIRIGTSAQLDSIVAALYQRDREVAHYKTVVIDGMSTIADRILQEWIQRDVARNQTRGGKGNIEKDRTIDDVQREDYGKALVQMRRIFGWYRDLPMHVICTALAKAVYPPNVSDTRTVNPIEYRPLMTDSAGNSIMGMFDHVWYYAMAPNQIDRYMIVRPGGLYRAKTRGVYFPAALGGEQGFVMNPSLPAIYDLWLAVEGPQSRQNGASAPEGQVAAS